MTYEKAFVIGDIHGMYHSLEKMLTHWNKEEEQLIFVGDYIDRGPHSDLVINKVRELQAQSGAILLRGNHEQLLLNYLQDPKEEWLLYKNNGGATTLAQLLEEEVENIEKSSPQAIAERVIENHPTLVEWLESLVFYASFGHHLVVHAGIDFTKSHWRYTSLHDFLWIRDNFHYGKNNTGRSIIFGHTPVLTLQDSIEPWHRDDKWGIDGGNVYGGSLIGLRIDQDKVQDSVVLR